MKNIAKILKQALRKSATNILEDKETLLTEQPAHGYLMILKTCSHQTDGTARYMTKPLLKIFQLINFYK